MMRTEARLRALGGPAVAIGVLALAVLLPAGGASAAFPGKNGRIAYDSDISSRYFGEGFDVNSFGLGTRPVVRQLRLVYRCRYGYGGVVPIREGSPPCWGGGDPAYAPDGRSLAFVQGGIGQGRPRGPLAVANDDGSGVRSLPQLTAEDGQPAWSPRGTSLVFRGRSGSNFDLYVVRADGSGLRRLTYRPARDSDPAWTGARGGWIVFRRGGNLFTVRPDGTRLRRLTWRGGAEPVWSPHGSRIAFTRRGNLFVIRADGSGLRRLTWKGGTTPVWSPDGRSILFHRMVEDGLRNGVYVMRSSGRRLRLVLYDPPIPEHERGILDFDWGRAP